MRDVPRVHVIGLQRQQDFAGAVCGKDELRAEAVDKRTFRE
jgi:hypothetical protein